MMSMMLNDRGQAKTKKQTLAAHTALAGKNAPNVGATTSKVPFETTQQCPGLCRQQ
jgi:hypothetical protein